MITVEWAGDRAIAVLGVPLTPSFYTHALYACGELKPNFPMPAIPTTVGYMPEGEWSTQPYPSAYWYVCSRELLWTFFQKFGFIWERR